MKEIKVDDWCIIWVSKNSTLPRMTSGLSSMECAIDHASAAIHNDEVTVLAIFPASDFVRNYPALGQSPFDVAYERGYRDAVQSRGISEVLET